MSLVAPSETGKSPPVYDCLKIWTFQPKVDEIYFFHQQLQPLYDAMQK